MDKQSQRLVMSNEIIDSALPQEKEKNMKLIEKENDKVWKDNKTGKLQKGKECPFTSGVLVAGIGDPVPDMLNLKNLKQKS